MRKRQYQFGSVRLEPRKSGPDVWVYRYRDHSDKGVYRKQKLGTADELRDEFAAFRAAEQYRLQANPETSTAETVTVGALIDRYISDELPERHSTRIAYTSYIEVYIRPKWQDYAISGIKPMAVENWVNSLKLAPKSRGNVRDVMRVVFGCAQRWGLLDGNPIALVRVKGVSKRQRTPRVLDHEQLQRLLAELPGEPYRTMVILDCCSGLRCSELLALKWSDVDWDNLTLKVERAIVDGVEGPCKTRYSEAPMPLDPALVEILGAWRQESKFTHDTDWIFASWRVLGKMPFRSSAVRQDYIQPAALRAGLGNIGWHTFRHTFSTMLRSNGEDLKVQQELLRHADIRTTMNVYTQAVSSDKREAQSKIVRMVLPTRVKQA